MNHHLLVIGLMVVDCSRAMRGERWFVHGSFMVQDSSSQAQRRIRHLLSQAGGSRFCKVAFLHTRYFDCCLVLQVDEGDEGGLAGLDDEEEDGGEDEGLHGEGKPAVGALEASLPGVGGEMEEESRGDGHDNEGISGYELRGYLGMEVGEDGCGHVADMADRLGTEEGEADGDKDEGDEDVGGADDGAGHYVLF